LALPGVVFAGLSCVKTAGPAAEGGREVRITDPRAARAYYDERLDALLPGIGADNLLDRQQPQLEFEQLCFAAGAPGRSVERVALCEGMIRRLGPETAYPARVWLLRQLARLCGEESVSGLEELLADADPYVRELARQALQNNPSPHAGEVLQNALAEEEEPAWRVALINALAGRREQAAVPQLVQLSTSDDVGIVHAALAALGSVGGAEALAAISTQLKSDSGDLREAAAAALMRCGEALLAAGERPQAEKVFADVWRESAAPALKAAALHGLAEARGAEALETLFEIAAGEDERLRLIAARFVVELAGPQVTRAIVRQVFGLPGDVQALLIIGLGERGDARGLPAVQQALTREDAAVRLAGVEALGWLGDHTAVMRLADVAAGSDETIAAAARRALARLRGAQVDETILKSAAVCRPEMAAVLIRSLGDRVYREAVPALIGLAGTAKPALVRAAAFETLGRLAAPDVLPELVPLIVRERDADALTAAEDAVVTLANQVADREKRADAVLAVHVETEGGPERARLIRVLGRLGGKRSLDVIRVALNDTDPAVLDAAVRALAAWPDAAVLEDLAYIARADEQEAHRILALRAYVRLVRLPSERTAEETVALLQRAFELARRPDERKLVLAALAEVFHPQALALAVEAAGDDALRKEAVVAATAVARALSVAAPDEVLAELDKLAAAGLDEAESKQVDEAHGFVQHFRHYITTWQVSAPYTLEDRKGEELFGAVFPPEDSAATDVVWKELPVTTPGAPWMFDLLKSIGGGQRCAYVRTWVWSETAQPARLELGSDDGVKAWFDGEPVHERDVVRALAPAQDQVEVELAAGWNPLMLKITQGSGEWGFCCGMTAPDGGTLEGVRFSGQQPE